MKNITNIIVLGLLLCGLSLTAQKQFTNTGNFTIHSGGTVSFFGDLINNGTLIDSGLAITLAGSSAQQIGGSSLTAFKNLTLNNSSGSYLSANEKITNELTITAGTFSTTGYNFTLVSDANGTAYIAPIVGNFAGNITMQRYLPPGPTDWRVLASPVSGATISNWQDYFYTTGFPGSSYPSNPFISVYTYDETVPGNYANGYVAATNASNPIIPGQGYWCYIGPVPLTFQVTGPPVKFNQTFPVTYTPSGDVTQDGWVMIGNPYPSSVDWSSAAWTKSNINNAIYIWNSSNQQYASWVGGVSTNGGTNIVASSQSFWVQTNALSPSLSCTENCKISSNPAFLKTTGTSSFNMMKLSIQGNNFIDETVLQFGSSATNGYDPTLDARKLFSSNALVPGIATQDTTKTDLSINSMPPITAAIDIPVKAIVGVTGNYTITIDSSFITPTGYTVVLEDLVTGTKTNLGGSLTYAFAIADTTSAARFVLHVLSGANPLPVDFLYFNAKPEENTVVLNWATASEVNDDHFEVERSGEGTLFEYVESVKAYGNGNSTLTQKYNAIDSKPYNGTSYYRLKQVDKNGAYKYTNMISVNFNATFFLSVYPNPASSNLEINVSKNYINANARIMDVLGKEASGFTIGAINNQIDVSMLTSGIYYLLIDTDGDNHKDKIKIVIQK